MQHAARDQKTRFALLGMLAIEPMSGYDIRKTIDASIAHFWNESYGQIYPMLKGLAQEGLVTCKPDRKAARNRRVYAITAKGRLALKGWLAQPAGNERVRNELLLKLFFARNGPRDAFVHHLERYRLLHQAELTRFRAMGRDLVREHAPRPDLPFWMMTLRFGICQSEAALRWADEALLKLNPPPIKRTRKSGVA